MFKGKPASLHDEPVKHAFSPGVLPRFWHRKLDQYGGNKGVGQHGDDHNADGCQNPQHLDVNNAGRRNNRHKGADGCYGRKINGDLDFISSLEDCFPNI